MTFELRLDGRQSQTALMVQRGVCRLLREAGFATLTEFTLASGRRADIIALNGAGLIWIVEIKSSLEDFRADGKWYEIDLGSGMGNVTLVAAPTVTPGTATVYRIIVDAAGSSALA